MPKSKQQPVQRSPAFATGGAFDALAIEHGESDSDDMAPGPEQLVTPPSTALSSSSKKAKAKQRAKDRARKSALINEPMLDPPTRTSSPLPPPRTANGPKALPSKPVPVPAQSSSSEPPPKASPSPARAPELSPTTSTSASAATSQTSSPSASDLDDSDAPSHADSRPLLSPVLTQQRPPAAEDPSSPMTIRPSASSTPRTASFPLHPPGPAKSPRPGSPMPQSATAGVDQGAFGADHAPGKKWQAVITRVIWSLVMVCGFIALMTLGHVYLIVLVFVIQLSVFREVSNLFEVGYKASAREHARKQASAGHGHGHGGLSVAAKERRRVKDLDKNRWSKVMSWYFFCAVNYFLYGESIIYYFKHIVFIDFYLLPFARHHRFISLVLYLIGFLAFVANLDRGHLRRQFGLFSWIHMSLLLIVASGQFMVNNILEGLIWFWVPACLVIMNDVAAYVFGMLFGKHQLIKLSPKKTVEGFVGGYFTTVIFSVLWGSLFMGWNYMICPVRDLGTTAFSDVHCTPNPVFIWRPYQLPSSLTQLLSSILSNPPTKIHWTPFQIHCIVLGTFAGLVAPFGGFFASGFKRAFGIKDFGDTIPGHGGLTDRFDCQFIMGLFTYFYVTSIVHDSQQHLMTVSAVMEMIGANLNVEQQIELVREVGRGLRDRGVMLEL